MTDQPLVSSRPDRATRRGGTAGADELAADPGAQPARTGARAAGTGARAVGVGAPATTRPVLPARVAYWLAAAVIGLCL